MSQTLPPEIRSELDHLKEDVESIKTLLAKASTPLPNWLSTIFQGVTLTIVIGAAFWFSSLGGAVARTETAIEKVQTSVQELGKSVQELKESRAEINGRLRAIEAEMNGRFNTIESRLTNIESRLTSVEKKLERRR